MCQIIQAARRGVVAVAIVLIFTVGCAEGPRDSGGRVAHLSQPVDIQPVESRFNTFALLDGVDSYGLTQIIRDNGVMYLEDKNSGDPRFFIQHSLRGWFGKNTFNDYTSIEFVREEHAVSDVYEARVVQGRRRTTAGVLFSTSNCQQLYFVKRLKSQTIYDNDHNDADTLVSLRKCGVDGFDAVAFMNRFDFMSADDRAAIRARTEQSD